MNEYDDIDLSRMYFLTTATGATDGPISLKEIGARFQRGDIYPTAKVCEVGGEQWQSVSNLRREFPAIMSGRMSMPPQEPVRAGALREPVSQGIYRLLALFFGGLGAHNFYGAELGAGFTKLGLLLALIIMDLAGWSFLAGAILISLAVWVLIDLVRGPVQ